MGRKRAGTACAAAADLQVPQHRCSVLQHTTGIQGLGDGRLIAVHERPPLPLQVTTMVL